MCKKWKKSERGKHSFRNRMKKNYHEQHYKAKQKLLITSIKQNKYNEY